MSRRQDGSTDTLTGGLLRAAAVSGLVTGLAAAAVGGAGAATASCLSLGGFFSIGSGCTSTPLSFALVLGNGTANARGLLTGAVAIGNASFADARGFLTFAIANGRGNTAPGPVPPQTDVRSAGALSLAYGGGTDILVRTNGNLNLAVAQGDRYIVQAGGTPSDIGNVAIGLGVGRSTDPNELAAVAAGVITPNGPPSFFNLAVNLGDTGNIQAQGFGNSVLNIFGNRNALAASGMFNNATNFFGDDNVLIASNVPDPTANILRQIGGNVAFSMLGSNNEVRSGAAAGGGNGPLAIAGAIAVDGQEGASAVRNNNFGIELRTPFNAQTPVSVLAAGNKVAPKTLAAGSVKNTGSQSSGSLTKAGKQFSSSLTSLSTKFSGTVKKVTGGLAGGAKADAASTSHSEK